MQDLLQRPASSVQGLPRRPSRVIQGLVSVEECVGPFKAAEQALWRDKGATGDGLRYERAVLRSLGRSSKRHPALHNVWLRFVDANGPGYACPDIVVPSRRLLLECKLSWTTAAVQQVEQLYLPLLSMLYDVPADQWTRAIVCKHWRAPIDLPAAHARLAEPASHWSTLGPGLHSVLLPSP